MHRTIGMVGVVLATSCTIDLFPQGLIVCADDSECPDGWVCNTNAGRCAVEGLVDAQLPALVESSITPAWVPENTRISIILVASEPLVRPPVLELTGPSTWTLNAGAAIDLDQPAYSYSLYVDGTEGDGPVVVRAVLEDRAGNDASVALPNELVLDFSPPGVVAGSESLSLVPPARSSLESAQQATTGTVVRIGFTTSELLLLDPVVTVRATGTALTKVEQIGSSYVYEGELDATGAASGPTAVDVSMEDRVGHTGEATLELASPELPNGLELDTTPPDPPDVDTVGAIVLHRSPWGSEASGGARSNVLVVESGAVEPNATVRVFADADGELELAAASADEMSNLELGALDLPTVYIQAVDSAGNLSDGDDSSTGAQPTAVRDIVWTASMGGKVAGDTTTNPHQFDGRRALAHGRDQYGADELSEANGIARLDGATATTTGAAIWQFVPAEPDGLGERRGHALGFDVGRNQLVAFGGAVRSRYPATSTTYARSAAGPWRLIQNAETGGDRPGAVEGTRMVYDAARSELVMVGGPWDGFATWAWTGDAWRRLCTDAPCANGHPDYRNYHGLAYDPMRRVVVMFGGNSISLRRNDVWEWDGELWHERCTSSPCIDTVPAARAGLALSWDGNLEEILMVGGNDDEEDTWSWNGSRWQERCTDAACAANRPPNTLADPRSYPAMAWDPLRRNVVLTGGGGESSGCGAGAPGTWLWDGATWTGLTIADTEDEPPANRGAAMVFDPIAQELVRVGGGRCDGGYGELVGTNEEWRWNGEQWRRRGRGTWPNLALGAWRSRVAFNALARSGRGALFVFAETSTQPARVWELVGGQLEENAAPTAPFTLAGSPADPWFVRSAGSHGVVATRPGAAHVMSGALSWSAVTGPLALDGYAVASHGDGLVLHGTAGGTPETWTWTGSWSRVCGAGNACSPAPTAADGFALAAVPGTATGVVFGGWRDNSVYGETWLLESGAWRMQSTAQVASARLNHAMEWDPDRNRIVLFGGISNIPIAPLPQLDQLWGFDGTTWTEIQTTNVTSNARPVGVSNVELAFDANTRNMVFAGGSRDTDEPPGIWLFNGGGRERPGQVMRAEVHAAGLDTASLSSVTVRWHGEAIGYDGTTPTPGLVLHAWDTDHWQELETDTTTPGLALWSSDTAPDGALLPRLENGPERRIYFAATPMVANGQAAAMGSVTTDYVEVEVRFRRD